MVNSNIIYIAIALVVLAIATKILRRYLAGVSDEPLPPGEQKPLTCGTCDGSNDKCEQECLMEAATKDIEYFDDEELDRFAQKPSNEYSDEEAEEFREILYSMRQEEVKEWNRSMILRHINLPDQLKDEMIMMMEGEQNP